MNLILLTTSHAQIRQVVTLVESLRGFISANKSINLSLVVVESSLSPDSFNHIVHSTETVFASFDIVSVASDCFWTASIFKGLCFIDERFPNDLINSSRLILMNSDVTPSSWKFLLEPLSDLETLVTLNSDYLVQRSGFRLPNPCWALHSYPFLNVFCPRYYWECNSVPTRLVLFPAYLVHRLTEYSFIRNYLPHYAADFVITAVLSKMLSTLWLVRVDEYLIEDTTTTGLKKAGLLTIANLNNYLFSQKSTYNLRDAIYFPILFSILSLPFHCIFTYVFSSWIKYCAKILGALTAKSFNSDHARFFQ